MARLPKVLTELRDIEKIDVKDYTILNDARTSIEVVAKDGREYLVFNNDKTAKLHAVNTMVKHEDDPDVIEQLEMFGTSMEEYASDSVETNGVQYVLSYDQHHKVKLNNAVAFRTI